VPYLSLETNKKLTRGDFTLKVKQTSAFIAELLGKSEEFVMVSFKTSLSMRFGGAKGPVGFVELRSIGLDMTRFEEYSKKLCDFIEAEFEIPAERIYIDFKNVDRKAFGWNRSTF
jgi:phenylpyruvate tautomerase